MNKFWIVLLLVVGTFGLVACDNACDEAACEEPATEEVENEVEVPGEETE